MFQLLVIFIAVTYQPVTLGHYLYPVWCQAVGWCLSAAVLVWIPFWMISTSYKMFTKEDHTFANVSVAALAQYSI